jgi:hypothetical protein
LYLDNFFFSPAHEPSNTQIDREKTKKEAVEVEIPVAVAQTAGITGDDDRPASP